MDITRKNYEAFLLDKIEDNLSMEDNKKLEEFFIKNPDIKPNEDEYDEKICLKDFPKEEFPNKSKLLHKTTKYNIFIKVAVSVAIFVGIFATYLIINNSNNNNEKNNLLSSTIKIKNKENKQPQKQKENPKKSYYTKKHTKDRNNIYDTLYLTKIEENTETSEDLLFITNACKNIIVYGSEKQENENIIKSNTILTYEKNN